MRGVVLEHRVDRDDLALGGVWIGGISVSSPEQLSDALDRLIEQRQAELSPGLEQRRKECRDILRNGIYRPTGRAKPASEYLLRSARDGSFPRINGPVDANNLVSLKTLMPISLWDVGRAASRTVAFRLGEEGQSYVFNPAGHSMDLRDLVCGGSVVDGDWVPMVNPVKDGMATKTNDATTEVAAVIYAPLTAVTDGTLDEACRELLGWLRSCGTGDADGACAILRAGESKTIGPA